MIDVANFPTIDEAIRVYVEKRNELKAHNREAKTREEELKCELEIISMWLRDKADELGLDSLTSRAHGTAYRNLKESYRIVDWEAYSNWMVETGNLHCVERRVAKNNLREIHKSDGILPPGLDHITEVEFLVRKPTKGKE